MRAGILTAALIAAAFFARGVFADFTAEPAPHMTYWRTGGPKSSITLQDGVRWGPATEWFSGGQQASQGEYVDGVREGEWSFWLEDGTRDLERSGSYRDGKLAE